MPNSSHSKDSNYHIHTPINIECPFSEKISDVVLEYNCSKCNPGGFELQLREYLEIAYYFFNVHLNGFRVENIHTENIKIDNTVGSIIRLEGDRTKIKRDKINTLFYRIMARNYIIEILYWLSLSVMAGIVVYWIGRFFSWLEQIF